MDKLIELEKIDLTIFNQEYLKEINHFKWGKGEKLEFLEEMADLSPKERNKYLLEMKRSLQKKNQIVKL